MIAPQAMLEILFAVPVAPLTASVLSSVNIFDEDIGKQLDELRGQPPASVWMRSIPPLPQKLGSKREVGCHRISVWERGTHPRPQKSAGFSS